jgi:hypothetical protein
MTGMCICLAIFCGGFVYEICRGGFSNPTPMGILQNDTIFEKEVGNFRDQIVQMLEKGNGQRALKKLQNEINDKFQTKLDGIEKEVGNSWTLKEISIF